jgi:hypothetical protein
VRVANRNLEELWKLAVAAGDPIYEIPGPDDYTAGLYSYSFGSAFKHVERLCVLSPLPGNRAIREAFEPILMQADFDAAAWLSILETSATWLVLNWARSLPDEEHDHVLSWGPKLMPFGRNGHPEAVAQLMAGYDRSLAAGRPADHDAANTVLLSATEGQIELGTFGYGNGQNGYAPMEAWEAGTARLAELMGKDGFDQRSYPELQAAVRASS